MITHPIIRLVGKIFDQTTCKGLHIRRSFSALASLCVATVIIVGNPSSAQAQTNAQIYAAWTRDWPYDISGGYYLDETVYDWVFVGYNGDEPVYAWQMVGTQPVWYTTYYGDADNDGLGDNEDGAPNDFDADDDGLGDGFEVFYLSSSPSNAFSLSGTPYNDGQVFFGYNVSSYDADGDGLTNGAEGTLGTSPVDTDSDDDGIPDGVEVTVGTNPLDAYGDADSDGISDSSEYLTYGTDPVNADTDGDGVNDGTEVYSVYPTDPNDTDTDNDGLTDGDEVNVYLTIPNDPDTDDDTVNDGDEIANNTDPYDPYSY